MSEKFPNSDRCFNLLWFNHKLFHIPNRIITLNLFQFYIISLFCILWRQKNKPSATSSNNIQLLLMRITWFPPIFLLYCSTTIMRYLVWMPMLCCLCSASCCVWMLNNRNRKSENHCVNYVYTHSSCKMK